MVDASVSVPFKIQRAMVVYRHSTVVGNIVRREGADIAWMIKTPFLALVDIFLWSVCEWTFVHVFKHVGYCEGFRTDAGNRTIRIVGDIHVVKFVRKPSPIFCRFVYFRSRC